ncbi:MAG: winged helix-turn-helix transcriptional regulator [Desulfuromonadales bacterium]|nr:winged helix-turn-helix transcriptional regulator [Desulfuromonadales bacterium]
MKKTAQMFKALADETRLRIIALLAEGELCVCDLMAILDLPQSTVSRHLAYLRHAGWVDDRRQGIWMYYRLNAREEPIFRDLLLLVRAHLPTGTQGEKDRQALAGLRAERKPDCGQPENTILEMGD